MHLTLIILSSVIAICASVPYQIAIASGRVKPRIATWTVWGILAGAAGAAAFASHQLPAGVFTLSTCGQCFIIVALGYRLGDRKFEKLDYLCLLMALVGFSFLLFLKSPNLTIITAIITDIVGTIPTLKHCWKKPNEESLSTFLMFVVSEWLILFTVNFKIFAAFAYPVFYLIEDGSLTLIVLFRPSDNKALGQLQSRKSPNQIG